MNDPCSILRVPAFAPSCLLGFASAFAITLIASVASAQPTTAPAARLKTTETKVATLENAVVQNNRRIFRVSSDGNHVAVLIRKGDKCCVAVDGVEGKAYDWIVADTLAFTADSRVLYIVQQAGGMFVVVGDKEGRAYHEIVKSELLISRGGSRIGYRARSSARSKSVMVIDEAPSEEYDQVGALNVSADGKHVAFAATRGDKQLFIIDGVATGAFDRIIGPSFAFSPDGTRFAFGAVDLAKERVVPVADWKQLAFCDEMGIPVFSPDSKRLAYAVRRNGKMCLVLDGKEQAIYDRILPETIRFSPDSQRIAFAAVQRGTIKDKEGKEQAADRAFYVLDGKELRHYDQLVANSFAFSPDSRRFAYFAMRDGRIAVVIDDAEGVDFDDVRLARFSPDSSKLICLAARNGKVYAVVNNEEGPAYTSCGTLILSPDGQRIACAAERNGEAFAVVDRVEGRHYIGIIADTLAFTPDSRHIVYEARDQNKTCIVVDGAETADIQGSLRGSRFVFDAPDRLHTFILRNNTILKLEATIGQ